MRSATPLISYKIVPDDSHRIRKERNLRRPDNHKKWGVTLALEFREALLFYHFTAQLKALNISCELG